MRAELDRLRRELAMTAVYVTHDREDAAVLADRVVEMSAGRIISVSLIGRMEGRA
jgi:iron(III) transport system ATP-binding protein